MTLTRRGKVWSFLTFLLVLIVVAAGSLLLYLRSLGVIGSSHPGASVAVVITKGSSAADVAKLLEEEKVIPSALGFRIYLKLHGASPTIQAGHYELHRGLNDEDALAALVRQKPHAKFVVVTFPEGSWLTDFARILGKESNISSKRFLRIARSDTVRSKFEPAEAHTLEGLLFPSTYQIVTSETALHVLRRLVGQTEAQLAKIDLSQVDAQGYSAYQVITVASMIEAEAKVDADRPKIAEVIYNRLRQGIPLGIDATIEYALGRHVESLTESDLAVQSPYNTRLHTGLPPTPIGAPGFESLQAAAAPATGDLLYYVLADCRGHHFFTSDYSAFLRAKARYQALSC